VDNEIRSPEGAYLWRKSSSFSMAIALRGAKNTARLLEVAALMAAISPQKVFPDEVGASISRSWLNNFPEPTANCCILERVFSPDRLQALMMLPGKPWADSLSIFILSPQISGNHPTAMAA